MSIIVVETIAIDHHHLIVMSMFGPVILDPHLIITATITTVTHVHHHLTIEAVAIEDHLHLLFIVKIHQDEVPYQMMKWIEEDGINQKKKKKKKKKTVNHSTHTHIVNTLNEKKKKKTKKAYIVLPVFLVNNNIHTLISAQLFQHV